MAYTVGFPPTGLKHANLDQPSLRQETGETGDVGDEKASGELTGAELAGWHDPYAEAAERALGRISRPEYPAGMIHWLCEASPRLYAELTERLPEAAHRLWEANAPMEQFEQVLTALVKGHHTACQLYEAHLSVREQREGRTKKRTTR